MPNFEIMSCPSAKTYHPLGIKEIIIVHIASRKNVGRINSRMKGLRSQPSDSNMCFLTLDMGWGHSLYLLSKES